MNLGYGFENSFRSLGGFRFVSQSLGGVDAHERGGNRFVGTIFEKFPVPVPKNYLRGIDLQKRDFEKKKWSYLRGQQKLGGWFHYYIYALTIKTPVGTLFIWLAAAILALFGGRYRSQWKDELILLLPALVILLLVSSQTGFNRYLRYLLPAMPFIFIGASRIAVSFLTRNFVFASASLIALFASIAGSLTVFPHSMSYFNALVGGPRYGHAHLLDANIDWGQDLFELKKWVDKHPQARPFRLSYFGFVDPRLVDLDVEYLRRGVRTPQAKDGRIAPTAGWYAISVNHLRGYYHDGTTDPDFSSFLALEPVAMAGYSIYIYHLTIDDANKIRKLHGVSLLKQSSSSNANQR